MSAVLERSELEQSPLADLHVLANELGVDGFRRLRKAALVDAILERQGGAEAGAPDEAAPEAAAPVEAAPEAAGPVEAAPDEAVSDETAPEAAEPETAAPDEAAPAPRRARRGRRAAAAEPEEAPTAAQDEAEEDEDDDAPRRGRRGRRGGRTRARSRTEPSDADAREDRAAEEEAPAEPSADATVEGVVELLGNGSGFLRLDPPDTTDEDVYVSAAQVKRCELVSGDRVAGPVRAPRRSERFPSLIRVDTINGRPADEVVEGTRFEDLPAVFPTERFELGSDDPTLKAIEWLTPFGRGSRVVIAGPARAGKSEALRRLAGALASLDGLELTLVLAGVRPEEVAEWRDGPVAPAAELSFAASADARAQAVEQAVEQGRRVAARGGNAVVLIDALDDLPPHAARRALAAARNLAEGGSLTVVATAPAPLGGETTVVALDETLTALGRFPALDLAASGVLRPEKLVGEVGAEAIAKARAEAV
jgi:transcription termination factor Rho